MVQKLNPSDGLDGSSCVVIRHCISCGLLDHYDFQELRVGWCTKRQELARQQNMQMGALSELKSLMNESMPSIYQFAHCVEILEGKPADEILS